MSFMINCRSLKFVVDNIPSCLMLFSFENDLFSLVLEWH